MGWIKFQQGKTDAAEKYTFAAWQITDDQVIATHLGRIYETQGRKEDAIDMYVDALSTIPPGPVLERRCQRNSQTGYRMSSEAIPSWTPDWIK